VVILALLAFPLVVLMLVAVTWLEESILRDLNPPASPAREPAPPADQVPPPAVRITGGRREPRPLRASTEPDEPEPVGSPAPALA